MSRSLVSRFLLSQSTRGQAARFLLVGGSSMIVDLATYRLCLFLSNAVPFSKAMGFVIGTTFAFFANRTFTFKHEGGGKRLIAGFLSVYFVTLFINVGINSAMLRLLGFNEIGINGSFVVATICSAALNFVGMKKFVFNEPR